MMSQAVTPLECIQAQAWQNRNIQLQSAEQRQLSRPGERRLAERRRVTMASPGWERAAPVTEAPPGIGHLPLHHQAQGLVGAFH